MRMARASLRGPVPMLLGACLLLIAQSTAGALPRVDEPLRLPPDESAEHAVLQLTAVGDLDDLSEAIWPDWEISEVPFALHGGDGGFCILVNHPDPPDAFESKRTSGRRRERFHVAESVPLDTSRDALNGTTTAFIEWPDFEGGALSEAFECAFRAHLKQECPDLVRIEPPIDGYPLTPENLALADIECELLARAAAAPDDSLEQWTLDFVAVRNYRRMRMNSPAAEAFERRMERLGGLSAYAGERARQEAARYMGAGTGNLLAGSLGSPTNARSCLLERGGLDWYRRGRYCMSGAVLCELMDRFHPSWREEVGICGDPFTTLYDMTMTRLPRAFMVFTRYGFRDRMEERAQFIDSLKSDAERLFDGIVGGEGPKLVINTGLLQSTSVSYDPENLERVDESRSVHKRVIRIEFSGGTRVHIMGIPVAANTGEDEFDIQQLTITAPEHYAVTIGGQVAVLSPGVHEFDQPMSISADGLLIEARTGVVMVGEDKVTFMLHR